MRYFLHIAYDGTHYCGWQRQTSALSVQEVIEETLKKIFKKEITVWGCGRTDSGVHASQYFLHINLEDNFDFDLAFRLNKNLPDDIAVYDVLPMQKGQHTRFDATSRTYDYFINFYKDPFLKKYCSEYLLQDLDFEAMQKAAALIMQFNDFKSICRQPDLYNNTICDVMHAQLFISSYKKRMRFTITANRFLRGMVRLCVAFLLKIGERKMSLEEFENMLKGEIVYPMNVTALPNGLFLSKVVYPYLDLSEVDGISSSLRIGLE